MSKSTATQVSSLVWFVVATTMLGSCGGSPRRSLPNYPMYSVDLAPPELSLSRFPGGEPVSLNELRGKVVVLDVWATWCAPCKESLPELQTLGEQYRGRDVSIVTVNIDESEQALKAFVDEIGMTLPIWRDANGRRVGQQLRFAEAPTSYVLDRNGVVRFIHAGYEDGLSAAHRGEIDSLLVE